MFKYWVMHNMKNLMGAVPKERMKPFKCDRDPIFQNANLNRNLTQFGPSEIHYLPDPTARNGSQDI